MHPELQEAINLHEAIVAEAGNALVGYDTEKALANVVLLSEIPTTYDKDQKRQVNAGNLLLRGVPGVDKTFFGVILAAISNAKFARLQGRADLQPTEIVGFQMINPATGEFITEFGPLASAEVITSALVELGLVEGPLDEALAEQRYKTYYMHKCSHWLGMDVHDVGAYYEGGKARPLSPGMVLTVEPGIYISEHATGPAERYRGIGVRIEDDVLVTESGNEGLTEHIPRTVDAVESACQS